MKTNKIDLSTYDLDETLVQSIVLYQSYIARENKLNHSFTYRAERQFLEFLGTIEVKVSKLVGGAVNSITI